MGISLTVSAARRKTAHTFACPARSLDATAGASADVGGSWRIGIRGQRPAVQERIARYKGSGLLADQYRHRCGGQRCKNRGGADISAGHRLHTAVTWLVGAVLTAALSRHVHLGHRRHPGGHATCLSNRQAHPRGDKDREEQSDKISSRPVSHDTKNYAELRQKQAVTAPFRARTPAAWPSALFSADGRLRR